MTPRRVGTPSGAFQVAAKSHMQIKGGSCRGFACSACPALGTPPTLACCVKPPQTADAAPIFCCGLSNGPGFCQPD